MSDMIHLLYQGQIEQSAPPAEMYLHPKTRFAASFIGNYNIYTDVQFHQMTGLKLVKFELHINDVKTREELTNDNKKEKEVA